MEKNNTVKKQKYNTQTVPKIIKLSLDEAIKYLDKYEIIEKIIEIKSLN